MMRLIASMGLRRGGDFEKRGTAGKSLTDSNSLSLLTTGSLVSAIEFAALELRAGATQRLVQALAPIVAALMVAVTIKWTKYLRARAFERLMLELERDLAKSNLSAENKELLERALHRAYEIKYALLLDDGVRVLVEPKQPSRASQVGGGSARQVPETSDDEEKAPESAPADPQGKPFSHEGSGRGETSGGSGKKKERHAGKELPGDIDEDRLLEDYKNSGDDVTEMKRKFAIYSEYPAATLLEWIDKAKRKRAKKSKP